MFENATYRLILVAWVLSGVGCEPRRNAPVAQQPPTEKGSPAIESQASTVSGEPGKPSAVQSVSPANNSAGGVFFIDPAQYSTQRAAFSKDATGQIRRNTILLPAEMPDVSTPSEPTKGGYLGPQACGECHPKKLADFITTGHFRTSAIASKATILGSFADGSNRLETSSPNLSFEMSKNADGFYQRLLFTSGGEALGADFPFDLVTGSGKVAQTYLYWKGEQLYQLHATFLTADNRWVNSPGFDDGVANFARPIHAVCMECHSTFIQPVQGTTNQFKKDNFILGVTCERCHGPATEHANYHREHPAASEGHAIVNPSKLALERSLEVCQVCHGGMPTGLKQPPLSFRPGEPLDEYYEYPANDDGSIGIHTNSQLPRLQKSRCFQESEAMTCIDCHNPHVFERGNLQRFSDRCIACHEIQSCGKFEQLGATLGENCIDCHMPKIKMDDITFHTLDQQQSPTMRDHLIRVLQ